MIKRQTTGDCPEGMNIYHPSTTPCVPAWDGWHPTPDWWRWEPPVPEPLPYGWICPRCGRVWAPSVTECQNCRSATTTDTTTGSADAMDMEGVRVVLCEDEHA
jgi:hypothetical protein